MSTTISRQDAKSAIREMAVSIRVGASRNTLVFADEPQAKLASELFRAAGITCYWEGGRLPILNTAADFAPKAALAPVTDMTTPELVREFAETRVWFARNEVSGRHPAGTRIHQRLKDVVDQLRERHVLD